MTDRQRAVKALKAAAATCTDCLKALAEPSDLAQNYAAATLQKDLLSLLTLIYSSSTRLAITLKPSAPTYSAAAKPADELAQYVVAVSGCANLFNAPAHGATLAREVRDCARELIGAVLGLVQAFVALDAAPPSPAGGAGGATEDYLVRTGAVHALIERARAPDGIPKDNLGAVRKRWVEHRATLEDGLKEVAEMIEEGACEEGEDDDEDDFENEGWDEFGLESKKLTKNELARVTAVHPLLRVVVLLHKRILLGLLIPSLATSHAALDDILAQSYALLESFDDVTSTLYGPQDPTSILPAVLSLVDLVKTLQISLVSFRAPDLIDQLAARMQATSIRASNIPAAKGGEKKRDVEKWFDTCFAQIDKLSVSTGETLARVGGEK